jgi:putative hemolysin
VTVLFEIGIVLALMLVNGFLAMSEMAMVSSRRGRLEQLAVQGSRGARAAAELIDDPTRFLSTVQVGITLVGILAGAFSGATLGGHLAGVLKELGLAPATADTLAIVGVVLVITYLSLIVGELVPKRLALSNPEAIAARVARPMMLIAGLTAPLVWLLRASTNGVLRLLGIGERPETRVSEDEIRALLAEGAEAGVVKRVEHEMIEGIMRIADRPVRAIMTPRVELVWLNVEDDPAEIARVIKESGHSRFVIGKGGLDDVLGVVHVRSLLDACLAGRPLDVRAAVRPALVVHDNMPVLRALEALRQARVSMALVIDEYGEVEGVVTVEDVLEGVVGDMPERRLGEEPTIIRREDGSLLMDGLLSLDEVKLTLGFESLPDEKTYHTLGGFIMAQFGRVPEEGQAVAYGGWRFEVVDMDGRRIDKVLVRRATAREEDPAAETA